jgi:transketolase
LGISSADVADAKPVATRAASGECINALAPHLPELIGGSADLAPSNNTNIKDGGSFQPDSHDGRILHFGVREHAMGAALTGMSLNGGLIPFGGTFLVFSDYLKPAIRLAALSEVQVIYIFTHDSIGLGEDGPTHQPIEQIAGLRAIPEPLRDSPCRRTRNARSVAHRDQSPPRADRARPFAPESSR